MREPPGGERPSGGRFNVPARTHRNSDDQRQHAEHDEAALERRVGDELAGRVRLLASPGVIPWPFRLAVDFANA
jgi:hypothetical protein